MRKNTLLTTIARLLAAVSVLAASGVTVMAAPTKPIARSGEILIKVPAGTSSAAVDQLASRAGCEVIRPIAYSPDTYLLGLKGRDLQAQPEEPTPALLQAVSNLRGTTGVLAAPNFMRFPTDGRRTRATAPPGAAITPNDTRYNEQWGMKMVRMPEAWNIQFGTRPVLVAVIDTGVDKTHPDFIDSDGTSHLIESLRFDGGTPGVDTYGHGTHVAGTIAASTNNGLGVTGVGGWTRNGANIKIIDAGSGGGGFSDAALVSALNYCIQRRVDVINMSLGGYGDTGGPFRTAVLDAVRAGIVVVCSAGNGTQNHANNPAFPADYPGVIKVTAVGPNKILTWYSDYGGTENRQIIGAPGGALNGNPAEDILSTFPVGGATIDPNSRSYISIAGTSMAAPHVAGAAALLIAAGVPPSQVYKALSDGAQAPGDGADANKYGPGILDVYSALLPYSDPDPSVGLVSTGGNATSSSSVDRGIIYFHQFPITIRLMGVAKIVASGAAAPAVNETDVTVEVQTLGSQPATVARFVGGRNGTGDFDIPTLGPSDVKATVYTVPVPRPTASKPVFGPGQYRIVTKIKGTETSIQFITIQDQALPAGRSMVAFPFRAGLITSTTPERGILGLAPSFSLARYNANRLPGEEDYARFRSNGSLVDNRARFLIPGAPQTFETIDPTTSISPIGNGYWIDLDRATTLNTTLLPSPDVDPVNPTATSAVGIRLYGANGGWNMIGAPYLYPVDWGATAVIVDGINYTLAEAVNAGVLAPALIGYRGGDYDYKVAPLGRLEPFRGYWVRAYRDCILVVPPSAASSSRSVTTRAVTTDGWSVRLVAMAAGDHDGQNYFGLSRGASDGSDRQDIPKPPAGAGHVYARFVASETDKTRSLAYDLRSLTAAGRKQEWALAVSTDRDNADVTLAWEGVRNAARSGRLFLTDLQTGVKVALDGKPSYTFRSGAAGSTRNFKITLEPQATRGALALNNLRVGSRATGGWTVRFTSSQEADITARVVTLGGRQVGVLSGPTRAEAMSETTLRWDGRSIEGAPVPAGPYRIEIMARTTDQQAATVHRIIQVIR